MRAVQQVDLFHYVVGKAIIKNAGACTKYGLSLAGRVSQGNARREVRGAGQVLLPVIAQSEHQCGMMLKADRVLDKSICLMLGVGEMWIPCHRMEQHRRLSVEAGETGKRVCPVKIRRIAGVKEFRQKSRSSTERVLAVHIVNDVLDLHPCPVLRKCRWILPSSKCAAHVELRRLRRISKAVVLALIAEPHHIHESR